jgi:hypothetical protein
MFSTGREHVEPVGGVVVALPPLRVGFAVLAADALDRVE